MLFLCCVSNQLGSLIHNKFNNLTFVATYSFQFSIIIQTSIDMTICFFIHYVLRPLKPKNNKSFCKNYNSVFSPFFAGINSGVNPINRDPVNSNNQYPQYISSSILKYYVLLHDVYSGKEIRGTFCFAYIPWVF